MIVERDVGCGCLSDSYRIRTCTAHLTLLGGSMVRKSAHGAGDLTVVPRCFRNVEVAVVVRRVRGRVESLTGTDQCHEARRAGAARRCKRAFRERCVLREHAENFEFFNRRVSPSLRQRTLSVDARPTIGLNSHDRSRRFSLRATSSRQSRPAATTSGPCKRITDPAIPLGFKRFANRTHALEQSS
jgi:hypothetical protein